MSRGYIYGLQTVNNLKDIESIENPIDEDSLYENWNNEFEYLNNIPNSELKETADNLEKMLSAYDGIICKKASEYFKDDPDMISVINNDGISDTIVIEITDACRFKESWFKASFDKFKEIVHDMTLQQFANNTDDYTDNTFTLKNLIEDTWSDAISTEDETFRCFDRFVRDIKNETYILTGASIMK